MRRLIALEWNEEEARLVVASGRKGMVRFEQAFAVPLTDAQPTGGADSPAVLEAKAIGQKIARAASERGVGRWEVLVALGRSSIELRQLTLPPAPDEELPNLVRFQAVREFNALEDDWLLDFVPIDEASNQPRTVLAAAIGPELVRQIQEVCASAGWKLGRMVLRPCASASLVARQRPGSALQARLIVDLLGQEADLTVLVDRKVLFLRTTRLPGNPLRQEEAASDLLLQIRRTMAAVANQLEGRRVGAIVLCGAGTEYETLAHLLDRQLEIPTELFDPLEGLELGEQLAGSLPEEPGRYAPLVGMLWDELEGISPAIDFLHPRRPPEPPSPRRKLALLAAAVFVAVMGFFGYQTYGKYTLSSQVDQLRRQSQALDTAIKQAEQQQKMYVEIARWKDTDVHWLEELRRLSEQFPPARQVMVSQILMGPGRGGGILQLTGLAASASDIDALVQRLQDAGHSVVVTNRAEDPKQPQYRWQFKIHISAPHQ
jgi:Tfp pilus assembly PilM family ATPase